MRFTLAPDLAPVVRYGVIWLEGATVVEREPRLTAPIAATEAAVRIGADVGGGSSHRVNPAALGDFAVRIFGEQRN